MLVKEAVLVESASLFNGEAEKGREYRVDYDGGDLPAGMYIYKLITGQVVQSGKLIRKRD